MSSYDKLIKGIRKVTEDEIPDFIQIWLKQETANGIIAESNRIAIVKGAIVLIFPNGQSVSITKSGSFIEEGSERYYWTVVKAENYEFKEFESSVVRIPVIL